MTRQRANCQTIGGRVSSLEQYPHRNQTLHIQSEDTSSAAPKDSNGPLAPVELAPGVSAIEVALETRKQVLEWSPGSFYRALTTLSVVFTPVLLLTAPTH